MLKLNDKFDEVVECFSDVERISLTLVILLLCVLIVVFCLFLSCHTQHKPLTVNLYSLDETAKKLLQIGWLRI